MKKQIFKKMTAFLLVLAMLPVFSLFTAAASARIRGTWENLSWVLNRTTGELVISGEGEMASLDRSDAWLAYSESIQSVTVEDGVTSIAYGAFIDCPILQTITIPSSVTSIGMYIDGGCISLTDFEVASGNESYCSIDGILYNKSVTELIRVPCMKSGVLVIPNGVTSIGDFAIEYCSLLTSVTFPASLTAIGRAVFQGCSGLTTMTIPDSVTTIDDSAFGGCTALTSITLPSGITIISPHVFSGCDSLTSITIPDGVTTIESGAFSDCNSLTSITIPDSVTSFGYSAFVNCDSLTSLPIAKGVTTIGEMAFSYCDSLTDIIIPDHITRIGTQAFANCDSLTSIYIPNSVTSISHWAFYNCPSLNKMVFCGTKEEWNNVRRGDTQYEGPVFFHDYQTVSDGDASHKIICSICGDVQYSPHSWDDGVITTHPTDKSEGVKTFTCTDCGETKTESIPTLVLEETAASTAQANEDTTAMPDVQLVLPQLGCGGSLNSTYAVIALVAILGFVFVAKKKENE